MRGLGRSVARIGKMKYFLVLLVFAAFDFRNAVDAAVSRYQSDPKPDYYADQAGCFLEAINQFMAVNEPFSPDDGSCTQYTCQADNGEILMFTCGAVPPEQTCNRDLTKPYPDCCIGELCPTTTAKKPEENPLGDLILNSAVPAATPTAPKVSTKNPAKVRSGNSQAYAEAQGVKTNTLAYAAPGRSQATAQSSS